MELDNGVGDIVNVIVPGEFKDNVPVCVIERVGGTAILTDVVGVAVVTPEPDGDLTRTVSVWVAVRSITVASIFKTPLLYVFITQLLPEHHESLFFSFSWLNVFEAWRYDP